MMKGTLGHQTEEEKTYYDAIYRNSRIRALDTVIQKLQVEIASAERTEKHTLSDEEKESALRNIGMFDRSPGNMQPNRSSADLKKELFRLMADRENLALDNIVKGLVSDFAAAKNPRPSVPVSPFMSPSVSTASSKTNKDEAIAKAMEYLDPFKKWL